MSSPLPAFDRRRFLGMAGLGLSAAALAACSGPSTSKPSASAAPTDDVDWSKIKPASQITFWSSNPGKSQPVTQQIIDAFHASQPDIKVNLVTAGATYEEIAQRFQAAQAGGQVPDVLVLSDVWWFRYYMQRSIVPLDSLVKAVGINKADYRDQFIADYQYEGGQWAIPWARSTPLFYYNKNHWQAAGLPDRAPNTWEEFADWAPRIQAAGVGTQHTFQLPALKDYAGWSFQNNLWGWGGGWGKPDSFDVTCDSAESVAAIQFLQDSVYKGKWAGVASNSAPADLTAGAVSATISSTGDLVGTIQANAKFPVGVGFLPGGPKEQKKITPTGGAGLGIPKGIAKENQLAAARFIKFITEPANAVMFSAATGYIPVRKSADVSTLLAKNPLVQVAIDQLGARARTQDRARVFFPGADQEMAKSMAGVLTGQADVKSTLTTLKGTLTTIFDRDVKPNI